MHLIFTILFVVVIIAKKTTTECCGTSIYIMHACASIPHENHYFFQSFPSDVDYLLKHDTDISFEKCYSRVCPDTKILEPSSLELYCGVGNCNIFGCNCDDGCCTGNNEIELIKWFAKNYNFTFVGLPSSNKVVKFDDNYIQENYK